MTQFAIDFKLPTSYSPADFALSDANRLAYDWVMRWPGWDSPTMAISGPPACGKTHLASIWAQKAGAAILPPSAVTGAPAELFAESDALAIDGDWPETPDETALFHLLNYVRNEGKSLLLTHREPPARWPVALPDLASRLKALPHVAILPADDELLRILIMKQCADRQLSISPDIVAYILKHADRSAQAASSLIARLDSASLQQGRTITLPFVSKILSEN